LDEVKTDAALVGPAIEGFADELRPVVADDRFRHPMLEDGPLQNSGHANS
jgi:hypothetical protein